MIYSLFMGEQIVDEFLVLRFLSIIILTGEYIFLSYCGKLRLKIVHNQVCADMIYNMIDSGSRMLGRVVCIWHDLCNTKIGYVFRTYRINKQFHH